MWHILWPLVTATKGRTVRKVMRGGWGDIFNLHDFLICLSCAKDFSNGPSLKQLVQYDNLWHSKVQHLHELRSSWKESAEHWIVCLFVCLFVWGRLIFCVLGSRLPIRRRYTIPPLTQVHATVIILFHSNWGIRILAKASQQNRTSLNDIDLFITPEKQSGLKPNDPH